MTPTSATRVSLGFLVLLGFPVIRRGICPTVTVDGSAVDPQRTGDPRRAGAINAHHFGPKISQHHAAEWPRSDSGDLDHAQPPQGPGFEWPRLFSEHLGAFCGRVIFSVNVGFTPDAVVRCVAVF